MEYASNAKGNLGVTLGAIGTGLSALGGAGILTGLGGGLNGHAANYVTKDEMNLYQTIAAKDSEISLLKSESNTESKMIEVYNQAHAEIVNLRDNTNASIKELQNEINSNRREQDMWNASQSVANAQVSAAIATNASSISSIQSLLGQITQTKVPNSAVCPGWGTVNVTPSCCSGGTTVA